MKLENECTFLEISTLTVIGFAIAWLLVQIIEPRSQTDFLWDAEFNNYCHKVQKKSHFKLVFSNDFVSMQELVSIGPQVPLKVTVKDGGMLITQSNKLIIFSGPPDKYTGSFTLDMNTMKGTWKDITPDAAARQFFDALVTVTRELKIGFQMESPPISHDKDGRLKTGPGTAYGPTNGKKK